MLPDTWMKPGAVDVHRDVVVAVPADACVGSARERPGVAGQRALRDGQVAVGVVVRDVLARRRRDQREADRVAGPARRRCRGPSRSSRRRRCPTLHRCRDAPPRPPPALPPALLPPRPLAPPLPPAAPAAPVAPPRPRRRPRRTRHRFPSRRPFPHCRSLPRCRSSRRRPHHRRRPLFPPHPSFPMCRSFLLSPVVPAVPVVPLLPLPATPLPEVPAAEPPLPALPPVPPVPPLPDAPQPDGRERERNEPDRTLRLHHCRSAQRPSASR